MHGRAGVDQGGRSELYRNSMGLSASAESDDAPDRVVGRDTYCHAVTRNNFDSEAAHAAAELCEHFMALIALHAVQTAAVDRYDRALHINQIVLAQILSFLKSKIVPHLAAECKRRAYNALTASSICRANAA
ncbi:MAG TPA: hypothetical protein VNR64_17180 [Vicinamibacterales bacterium]|nr:hypothetical protein [Vicinamibacterales bacterium]